MRCSSMLVQVRGKRDQIIYGEIWSAFAKHPISFEGVGDMVVKMEEIYDLAEEYPAREIPRLLNGEMDLSGTKALMVVDIRSRDNYSMQGTARGPSTGGRYVYFHSALELMRMIRQSF